jgi:hypothetical protein
MRPLPPPCSALPQTTLTSVVACLARAALQPRPQRSAAPPAAPAAAPPPPPKAAPPPPPPPPKYTGPVTRPTNGKETFELVKAAVASVVQCDPQTFSEKTKLLADYDLTNEDAADITRYIGERGGVAWEDADWQTMRMSLLQARTHHTATSRLYILPVVSADVACALCAFSLRTRS